MPPEISAIPAFASTPPVLPTPAAKIAIPAPTATVTSLHASPVSLLDASTGLVVLTFYNDKGEETASTPTKKQLDLYRRNEPSPDIFQPSIRDITAPVAALPKQA